MRRPRAAVAAAIVGSMLAVSCARSDGRIYDPRANAAKQLTAAGKRAAASDKRVLVIIGGDWCKWCQALDGLLTTNDSLRRELGARYEVVHLNYSKENKNEAVMVRLGNPEKLGFPVLVVLSQALEVVHTQESGSLESGTPGVVGHDPDKVLAFLRAWSTAPTS